MNPRRRALLRGLGLGGVGLLAGGCGALDLLRSLRPDERQIGCTLTVGPIWPMLLGDITSNLAALEQKYLDATDNYRWGLAETPSELADLAAAQVRAGVSLLLAIGTPAIQAAASATTSVPIVGVQVGDAPSPAAVARLVRPDGNLTAAASAVERQLERQLELLRQVRPDARRVGLLWRPDSTWPADTPSSLSAAAGGLGLTLEPFELRTEADLPGVIAAAGRAELGGLLLVPEWQTSRLLLRIVDQSDGARLPLFAPYRRAAELGALACCGPDLSLLGRAAANLIGRILDGAPPSSLPLRRVPDAVAAVNPTVAARLGITLPADLRPHGVQTVELEL